MNKDLVGNQSKTPNFFILGGPKCGTTSLYAYLKRHRDILLSYPKEPNFFNTDFSDKYRLYQEQTRYLNECFTALRDEVIIGESSVWYLYSDKAVENILKMNNEAKFLVSIRNPVDMAYSLHSQMLFGRNENEQDFKKAWELQDERKQGRRIPKHCKEPKMLFYKDSCALGTQLNRLYSQVPKSQVKIVFFDHLKTDPKKVYTEILHFLNLKDDGFEDFVTENSNQVNKSETLGLILSRLGRVNIRPLKRVLGIKEGKSIVKMLRAKNSQVRQREPLNQAFRLELKKSFANEVALLENLTNENLDHWK